MKKILFLLFAAIYFNHSYAAPNIRFYQKYYEINGNSAEQLRAEMTAKGPRDNGRPSDAYTAWYIKWNYSYLNDQQSCRIKQATISAEITSTLPKWTDYEKASPQLQKQWDEYLTKLIAHEQGHALHGQNAAYEIESIINELPTMSDCQTLSSLANEKAQAVIAKYNAEDLQYDAETNHGASQGVVFP